LNDTEGEETASVPVRRKRKRGDGTEKRRDEAEQGIRMIELEKRHFCYRGEPPEERKKEERTRGEKSSVWGREWKETLEKNREKSSAPPIFEKSPKGSYHF